MSVTARLFFLYTLFVSLLPAEELFIGLMVEVRSPYENFNKRMEVQFKDKVSRDKNFDLMEDKRFGGHASIVELDVKYPVYVFPKQETIYVTIRGCPKGERYMCFSLPTLGEGKLTSNQEALIANDMIPKILEQIKGEFKVGPFLEPGYFNNKYQLNLQPQLVVELLGERVSPKELDLETLPQPLSKVKVEEMTIADEEKMRVKNLEKSVAIESLPKDERVKELRRELKMTWEGKRRSFLLGQLAMMYKEEDLNQDALAYAMRAYHDDPSEENFKLVRDLESNQVQPLDRFRFNNRLRNLDLSFLLKTEVDNNVIQDAIDSLSYRNKDDLLLQAAILADKKWSWKLGDLEQFSSYDFSQSLYAEEQDLDLMSHRVGYDMSQTFDDARMTFGVGYNYFLRRGRSLLEGADVNWSLAYYVEPYDQEWNISLFWLDKNYSDHFYNSDVKDGDQWRINLSWQAELIPEHRLRIDGGTYRDNLEDATLSYDAYTALFRWDVQVAHLLIDTISPSLSYEFREFIAAEPGRSIRKDAKFIYGLQGLKKLNEFNSLHASIFYTDNQSSRRINRYKRTQISLGYQIDF